MYNSRPSRFGSSRGPAQGGRSYGGGRPQGGGRPMRRAPQGRARQSFDPSMFIKKAQPEPEETFVSVHQFADFDLGAQLQRNIASHGYHTPTPIQDQIIPLILEGKDVVGQANTGTGKTAAFLLPLIAMGYVNRDERTLIVTPTRELATQIQQEFQQFTHQMKIFSALCIGGVNMQMQMYRLSRNPSFVIGTPGRLRDLEQQGALDFSQFTRIVLDEVDHMLDMGFIRDVQAMIAQLPKERHSLFFSATMPPSIATVARQLLHNPVTVSVKSRETTSNIDQDVIRLQGRPKTEVLVELLKQDAVSKVIVFVRTKRATEVLARDLAAKGFRVGALHGNKTQHQRQHAIDQFKRDQLQVLLATDVASRGLDIDSVTHVINYDLPETYEDYIHRIGRTGRANKKGIALTFVG